MTGIIIQARMGSRRFPDKMMALLHGIPIIEWVIRRTKRAKLADMVILATSIHKENDILEVKAHELGIEVFRGSEDDVLERFALAANTFQLETIVRVCADNPLVCPDELDKLIYFYREQHPDYAFNIIPKLDNRYPDGLGGEIVSNKILQELHQTVVLKEEREHFFNHIWNNAKHFTIATFKADAAIAHPEIRLDVNNHNDLDYLNGYEFDVQDTGTKIIRRIVNARVI